MVWLGKNVFDKKWGLWFFFLLVVNGFSFIYFFLIGVVNSYVNGFLVYIGMWGEF